MGEVSACCFILKAPRWWRGIGAKMLATAWVVSQVGPGGSQRDRDIKHMKTVCLANSRFNLVKT